MTFALNPEQRAFAAEVRQLAAEQLLPLAESGVEGAVNRPLLKAMGALGRTHLYDPQWTLHAAAEQGYPMAWPKPFAAGSRKPQTGRSDGPEPRLDLVRSGPAGTAHARWRPGASS